MTPTPFADEAARCRTAQQDFADQPLRARLRIVRDFRRSLVERADELTRAIEADVARPPIETLGSDVLPLAAAAKYLEQSAEAILAPRTVTQTPLWLWGQSDAVYRRPLGVVGIIGTWNYPVLLNGVQILQALVAGNGVLWKPSEFGATSGAILHSLFLESGVAADLFQRLPSDREAGPRLVESDIDHLIFTGSTVVGRRIAVRLAERLIPSTLELSGVDALIVCSDADLDLAARAATFGLTLNRGQTCLAVRRMLVHESVADAFVAKMQARLAEVGELPLVSPGQIRQAQELMTDAVARGGRLLGAPTIGATAMTPHVVVGGTPDMRVCTEECFGPMAAVMTFASIQQLLAIEARCPYALGASIFTRSVAAAEELARRLRVGHVSINDVIAPTAHPATPFGGAGASGWGETQGAEGLLAMTRPQTVSRRQGTFRPHYDKPTPQLGRLLRGLLRGSHGRWWSGRKKKAGA